MRILALCLSMCVSYVGLYSATAVNASAVELVQPPNECPSDSESTVVLPASKGARILATRMRAEVSYFWVQYNRDGKWLADGPPFGAIDPEPPKVTLGQILQNPKMVRPTGIEYTERTAGALAAVPNGQLRVRIQARWAIGNNRDRCMPLTVTKAATQTVLQFFTGNNEPWNQQVVVVYQ